MNFPSKILLFGEYTIITGGEALAIPFWQYSGHWGYSEDPSAQMNLVSFSAFLEQHFLDAANTWTLDTDRFKADLGKGLYFHSNIPAGYGLGSSGALVAAVFDRFGVETSAIPAEPKLSQERLFALKNVLAAMESFFHGSSSGIDPLISFVQRPLLFGSGGAVSVPALELQAGGLRGFLVDTGIPRSTGPLVRWFKERMLDKMFERIVLDQLMEANQSAIAALQRQDTDELWRAIDVISRIQFDYFSELIPEAFREIWKQGLAADTYRLKLCGAGGGGFILGFAREEISVEAWSEMQIVRWH